MKKLYTLILFSIVTLLANATVHTITVADFSFSPSTTNAVCGDTIEWVWSSGTHTTSSTTLPACPGFVAWDVPISSTNTTYSITVPCAGTYAYQCNIHTSMQGTIVVTCSSGVAAINSNNFSFSYPNPFSERITIENPNADAIVFYNIMGEKIKTITLGQGQTKAEVNTTNLKNGIYFYSIIKEGTVVETKKIVKN